MLTVLINTTPLGNQNAARGIGVYTRSLVEALERQPNIKVITSHSEITKELQPDIIHYPFFDLFFNTLPLLHRYPVVVTIHDVIPLVFPKYYRPGVRGYLRFFQQKHALKNVARIITDSQSSKTDIHRLLKIKEDKIDVIYLSANDLYKKPTNEVVQRVRRKYKLPTNYILYVGDINYNKNIPQLIKSLKFLPEKVKLVCVGKNFYPHAIPEWKWIETQLALSNVESRVKFVVDISRHEVEELSAIYHSSIAYIQPSLYEGFGLPVLEAMKCQTPVIAARNSSLVEVGGNFVLYAEPTAESIATKVTEIMSWSNYKRDNFVKAAERWGQGFNWDKVAKETMRSYRKVLDR